MPSPVQLIILLSAVIFTTSAHCQEELRPELEKQIARMVDRSLAGRGGLLSLLRRHKGLTGAHVRTAAYARLERAGDAAITPLLKLLRASPREIGDEVARTLAKVATGHDEIVPRLLRVHEDPDSWDVVPRIAWVLRCTGRMGIEALIGLLDHDVQAQRDVAFEQLRTLKPPPKMLLDKLVSQVEGKNSYEAAAASTMLARLGEPGIAILKKLAACDEGARGRTRAIEALILADALAPDTLTGKDRIVAAEALLRAPRLVPHEGHCLVIRAKYDKEAAKKAAVEAQLKVERGLQMIAAGLCDKDSRIRRATMEVVSRHLQHVGRGLDLIIDATDDPDPVVRRLAIKVLGRVPHTPKVLVAVRRRLSDERPEVRKAAAQMLAGLSKPAPELAESLVSALDDASPDVRKRAATALGQIVPPPDAIVSALVRKLEDPDLEVAQAAAGSLRRLVWNADEKLPALAIYQKSERVREWKKEKRAALVEAMESDNPAMRSRRREALLNELVHLLGREAVPDLRKLLKVDDQGFLFAVLDHLGRMQAKEAVPDILPFIKHRVLLIGAAKALFMIDAEGTDDAIELAFDRCTRRQAKAMSSDIGNYRPKNAAPSMLKFLDQWGLDSPGWVVRGIAYSGRKEFAPRMMRLLEDLRERQDPEKQAHARHLFEKHLAVTALEALGALDSEGYRDTLKDFLHLDENDVVKREYGPTASDFRWAAAVALARLHDREARDYFCKSRRSGYLVYYTAPKIAHRLEMLQLPYDGSVQTFHQVIGWLGEHLGIPVRVTGYTPPELFQSRFDQPYRQGRRKITALELLRSLNRYMALTDSRAAIILEDEVRIVPKEVQVRYWRRIIQKWEQE